MVSLLNTLTKKYIYLYIIDILFAPSDQAHVFERSGPVENA